MPLSANEISDAHLRLLLAPGIGPITLRRLVETFGTAEAVVDASANDLTAVHGIGRETAKAIRTAIDQAEPDQERIAMDRLGVCLLTHEDPTYPSMLAAITDPPAALWVRGELLPEDRLAVAIVGARKCTAYGREQAGRFASLLAQSGLTIVSGGAFGIDGEAHRGALRVNGRTIVVMGCGLSRTYPPDHEKLFENIASEGGALVSEFPMNTTPLPSNFPRRNRIISGLSLGVLIIEAGNRSGALITGRLATEDHGREVMALPGRVDSPASAGCLRAIREGWAALVTSHADVLTQLDHSSNLVRGALEQAGHQDAQQSATLFDINLSDEQSAIIEVLRDNGQPILVDQLAARTQLPLSRLMADLTLLQIRGRIRRDHQGIRLVK